jgi:hypothetical protein
MWRCTRVRDGSPTFCSSSSECEYTTDQSVSTQLFFFLVAFFLASESTSSAV